MKVQTLVAKNLRRLRIAGGISQEALALDAGLTTVYVSRLENGRVNASVGVLDQLAKALNTDIRSFFDPMSRAAIAPLKNGRKPKKK